MIGYPRQMAFSPWLTQTAYSRSNACSQAVLAWTLPPAPACPHEPDKFFPASCCYLPYPPTKRQSGSRYSLSKLSLPECSLVQWFYVLSLRMRKRQMEIITLSDTVTKINKHTGNNCRVKLIRGGLRNRLLESSQSAKEIDPRLKWSQWRRAAPLTAQFAVLCSVFTEHILLKRKLHGGLEFSDQKQSIPRKSGWELATFGEGYKPTDSRSESNPMWVQRNSSSAHN